MTTATDCRCEMHRPTTPAELVRVVVPTDTRGVSTVRNALPCSVPECRAVLVLAGWVAQLDPLPRAWTCHDHGGDGIR